MLDHYPGDLPLVRSKTGLCEDIEIRVSLIMAHSIIYHDCWNLPYVLMFVITVLQDILSPEQKQPLK